MKEAPVKPPAAVSAATPAQPYDPLLDPLPQPEVQESDTDTAWARWQDMVEQDENSVAAADAQEPAAPSFADTMPMGLPDLAPRFKS